MSAKITLLASAISLALLSACSDDGQNVIPDDPDNINPVIDPGLVNDRRLKQIDNTEAFYAAIREGLIEQSALYRPSEFFVDDVDFAREEQAIALPSVAAPTGEADVASDAAVSAASDGSVALEQSSGGAGGDVTGTNVQEIGVDEQDRVKTDGEYLYVLDNRNSGYFGIDFPVIVEPLPVDFGAPLPIDLAVEEPGFDVTDVALDSSLYIPPPNTVNVRILSMQTDAPDATAINNVEVDLGGRSAQGMYLYQNNDDKNVILTSSGFDYYWSVWGDSQAFGGSQSQITKLDVTDPNNADVTDTFSLDGQIISSRRIGKHLFVATRFYPQIAGIDPYSMGEVEYRDAINNADLDAVMPTYKTSPAGEPQPFINTAGCFVANRPDDVGSYYTPDIVTLAVIDLDTMDLADSECFLGSTETLYASTQGVYLATTRYDYGDTREIDFADTDVDRIQAYIDPRIDTDIHQFSINGGELSYSGSGVVSGHLGWNPLRKPFRMSEKDGYLRVATFSDQQNESVSPINVTVLKVDGDSDLVRVAQLPNIDNPEHIGKPGEQLYASRFLGDKAYLVTFRQTDPLYVVDLSKPADPFLAGELEIEGYSDYLQPIGEDYLLGIGKDARPAPDGFGDGFGALQQGVKLSLFNVEDANNPYEVQSMVVGERGTESQALTNHRAITIQPANENHPTRIAFGIDVAGAEDPRTDADPWTWYPWNYTGLHGFEVRTGADAGITANGKMVVESASSPDGFRYGPQLGNDRAVIAGDAVYYIHGSRVFVSNWFDMDNFTGPR